MIKGDVGPLQVEKHIIPKWVYRNTKPRAHIWRHQIPTPWKNRWGIIFHR